MSFNRLPHAHSTRRNTDFGRLKVDVANTAFWEGREYRISYEYLVASGTTQVIKFSSPIDFIIQLQRLTCDNGGVRMRAFRSNQGAEGGTFATSIPVLKRNAMSVTPDVTNQVTITTGGTFTPSGGEAAVETLRIKSSGATAQKSTVSAAVGDERGLPAGDYYLVFNTIATGDAEGVYDLAWEER